MIGSIFLIDDNELDNFINRSTITQAKYTNRITAFVSAEIALDYFKALAIDSKQVPQLIFLDISMPFMDGFDFLDKFENLPKAITDQVRIVMLTSSINGSDIKRSMANPHVIKFLNKPLTSQNLESLVN